MRTSYKKNRPFDFKLIDHVEPNTVLYKRQAGLSNYDVMKVKTEIWSKIADIMNCDVDFCLMRWNNLHYQYRKEARRPGGSTWPYFQRLTFLSDLKWRPKTRSNVESQSNEEPKTSSEDLNAWRSYEDCVVMRLTDVNKNTENTFIIEEIIDKKHKVLQEEIIYGDHDVVENLLLNTEPVANERLPPGKKTPSPACDYLKISRILDQLKGRQRSRAERRIMAFLLKCQLRALVNESIDDLIV